MTEQEFIDRGDLVRINNADNILRNVVPENSSVVSPKDYQKVMEILAYWERELSSVMKID